MSDTSKQSEQNENTEADTAPNTPLHTSHGVTTIDENVIAKIAGMATREVPGVYSMGNAMRRAFTAMTERIPTAQTNVTGGINVQKGETQTSIEVTVVVDYGAPIIEVTEAIRNNIIEQIETSTGLEVVEVNIHVTDVHLPGGNGSGGAQVVRDCADITATRFLALSVSDAADDVVSVIRAGARGYVTKAIAPSDLVAAIERVASGDAAFSPRLAGFVLDAFGSTPAQVEDSELDLLSNREREVMRLIARGYTYKEVASELFISIKTVETHVSKVLRKLQLSNRYELTRWANARNLV